MNTEIAENETFATSSFYLAVFLLCKKERLIRIDKENPKRSKFIFHETPELKKFVYAFDYAMDYESLVMVDPRIFSAQIRLLKEKLYN